MARMLGNTETAFDSAQSQFWVVDAQVRFPPINDFPPVSFNSLPNHFTIPFFVGVCFGPVA